MIFRIRQIFIVSLLGIAPGLVLAQEGVNEFSVSDYEFRIDHERLMTSPGESDSRFILKPNPVLKDSLVNSTSTTTTNNNQKTVVTPVPATKAKQDKPVHIQKDQVNKQNTTKESDDSLLSFNFLYYIIQKYKLQDIVD